MKFLQKKSWNPYITGGLIGLLAMFTFYTVDRPMGIAGAFSQTTVMIQSIFVPEYVNNNEYIRKTMPEGPGVNWSWMVFLGIFIGAFISSRMSGEFKKEIVPGLWKSRFGSGKVKRLITAFWGGVILLFGALLAGGCTMWHGINGSLQLALSGWIFFMIVFITGIINAGILYRGVK
ncbi:MAG TPA: hypothetical protein ENG83_00820 [Nitrospirae bacterium]|nr:putative inner membrane protein [bacterium BMS3Abin06]HDH10746.1 hypothetical protein [Nitrospirota bacterium]HDZ03034.1 hypothetical protein [Nitrospirota bacterium]